MRKQLGLYVHIPFCKKKCAYCDFYSICDGAYEAAYISALCTQLADYASSAKKYDVDSVYLGGGTPSLLSPKSVKRLFKAIRKNMKVVKDCEISCEINPESANKKILKALKKAGVNRLSFGVQSTHDEELKTLSRLHSFADFKAAYELARKLKFKNISVDLMFGFPGQTMESLMASIDSVALLAPEHLSLYGLKLEEGTPLFEKQADYVFPDEDAEADMYFAAIERLKIHGYQQYEISNFSKPGFECRHNLKYWDCDEYLGIGAAAASYFGGKRFTFVRDVKRYIAALMTKASVTLLEEFCDAPPEESIGDYVMLRFRTNAGIDYKEFSKRFVKKDFEKIFGPKLVKYLDGGFVKKTEAGYAFTEKGFYISNTILSDILEF